MSREKVTVVLGCCDSELEVCFDEADAPTLAPRRLRKTVSCPACTGFAILTLTRRDEGGHEIEQELFE